MSIFRKKTLGQDGNILNSLLVIGGLTVVAGMLMQLLIGRTYQVKRALKETESTLNVQSAIESFLLGFRNQEMLYFAGISAGGGCSGAKSFFEALKSGSGCANSVTVFGTGVADSGSGRLYDYEAGASCTISATASNCSTSPPRLLVSIGNDAAFNPSPNPTATSTIASEYINDSAFKIYMTAINPERGIVEFLIKTKNRDGSEVKNAFAVRKSSNNFAHMEADGRVTQENPDPLSKCMGSPFADLLVYSASQTCEKFGQLGGGTGLAYYHGRYFGLRPQDGQVVDLSIPGNSSSFLVDEATGQLDVGGVATGPVIFPVYSKDVLTNVDDITVIGDQIYTISGSGDNAKIGALVKSGSTWNHYCVCDLGTSANGQGYGQANAGLSSLSWSANVVGSAAVGAQATFFIKTDSGDLLTAVVTKNSGSPSEDCTATNMGCVVVKDGISPPIEYSRTNGFDQTPSSKAYYLF